MTSIKTLSSHDAQGILFVVATPIGNLADITFRALEVLQSADLIAAEDTRYSRRLLNHYNIKTPLISMHEHNELQRVAELLPKLQIGEKIAVISDAGTPLISDPGYLLVQAAQEAHIRVVPIPGACAAISALAVSGLPTDRFIFEGFLPIKTKFRMQRLQELAAESRTIILYEAPHRIQKLLASLILSCGSDRKATLARELTKAFETIHHGTLATLQELLFTNLYYCKGEFVLILQGASSAPSNLQAIDEKNIQELLKLLLAEVPLKTAATIVSKMTKMSRNEVYKLALQLKKKV